MLKIKKIYVDSKYKTPDSISTSEFSIQLPETIYMPDNRVMYAFRIHGIQLKKT